jgi:hypothetical protein
MDRRFSYTSSYELPDPDPAKKVRIWMRISNAARYRIENPNIGYCITPIQCLMSMPTNGAHLYFRSKPIPPKSLKGMIIYGKHWSFFLYKRKTSRLHKNFSQERGRDNKSLNKSCPEAHPLFNAYRTYLSIRDDPGDRRQVSQGDSARQRGSNYTSRNF